MAAPAGTITTEAPNLVTLLAARFHDSPVASLLHHFEDVLFSGLVVCLLLVVARQALRKPERIPRGLQNAVEAVLEGLNDFILGILGPQGKPFVPYLGTLFLYILSMNLLGLIPGMKSPTANLNTTVALAITVFLTVQVTAIRKIGVRGYLDHLMMRPRTLPMVIFGLVTLPIMFLLEVLLPPVTLSLRLRGNIFGEDTMIAIFLFFGVMFSGFLGLPIGIPIHLPFMFLGLLLGTIQALVFTLLATIYLSMVLPHDETVPHEAH